MLACFPLRFFLKLSCQSVGAKDDENFLIESPPNLHLTEFPGLMGMTTGDSAKKVLPLAVYGKKQRFF